VSTSACCSRVCAGSSSTYTACYWVCCLGSTASRPSVVGGWVDCIRPPHHPLLQWQLAVLAVQQQEVREEVWVRAIGMPRQVVRMLQAGVPSAAHSPPTAAAAVAALPLLCCSRGGQDAWAMRPPPLQAQASGGLQQVQKLRADAAVCMCSVRCLMCGMACFGVVLLPEGGVYRRRRRRRWAPSTAAVGRGVDGCVHFPCGVPRRMYAGRWPPKMRSQSPPATAAALVCAAASRRPSVG